MTKLFYILSIFIFLFIQNGYSQQINAIPTKRDIVKIGLLIDNQNNIEAKQAAQMAIDKANDLEGKTGRQFQLIIRSMEGPWGTGSKQAVDLVFKENVWAILGSHDRKNAHLVEQVIAKTQTIFLSAWTTDPTLAYANVPWFFNCVPNNNQEKVVKPTSNNLFVKDYQTKYRQAPNDVAAYAFDGMNVLINAIKNSKYNRKKLQQVMSNSYYKGVTGLIAFGKNGSRLESTDLIEIKNGIPVKVEK